MKRSDPVQSYAWKSVYGALVTTLLAVVLGVGFFAYAGIFALLSDAASLLVAAVLTPVVWSLYLLNLDTAPNRTVLWIGAGAVVLIAVGSIGLIAAYLLGLESIGFGFLGLQFVGWILQGAWLLGIGVVGLRSGTVRRRTSLAGVAAGTGIVGGVLALTSAYAVGAFDVGSFSDPVLAVMALASVLYVGGFVLWALWLGGELRRRHAGTRSSSTTWEREARP